MRKGALYVILAATLWGTTGTAQALAPFGAGPLALGALRLLLGAGLLLLWVTVRGSWGMEGRWALRPLLMGAVTIAAYQLFFFAGVGRTGVAVGTMVGIGSAPIMAGLLDWGVRGERPSGRWVVATLLAVLGCVVLVAAGAQTEVTVDVGGIALAMGAGLSYAIYTLATKELLATHSPDAAMALLFGLGALLLLPLLAVVDLRWVATAGGLAVVLELGLLTVAVAYLFYARGLQTVSVATAVTLTLAEPLTAALLGIFVLREPVNGGILLGIGLLFSGLLVLAMSYKPLANS
jgi:DME family drug/metabolite transporter